MDGKRALDVTVGSVGLVLAAPILVAAWLVMRLSGDRGSFLYRATRVGEGGRPISVLKIRTMRERSGGPGITHARDERVTSLGRRLRRYRLDELPQLVNVVRGEMSLVGPRPEDPRYVDWTIPLHRRVFSARPGITGPSQLAFHDEADLLVGPDAERRYTEEILPAKLRLDEAYLAQRSALMDLEILSRTVLMILSQGVPRHARRAG